MMDGSDSKPGSVECVERIERVVVALSSSLNLLNSCSTFLNFSLLFSSWNYKRLMTLLSSSSSLTEGVMLAHEVFVAF